MLKFILICNKFLIFFFQFTHTVFKNLWIGMFFHCIFGVVLETRIFSVWFAEVAIDWTPKNDCTNQILPHLKNVFLDWQNHFVKSLKFYWMMKIIWSVQSTFDQTNQAFDWDYINYFFRAFCSKRPELKIHFVRIRRSLYHF